MIVIATDEAGYGPKLGPLVVAASAWRLPDGLADAQQMRDAFGVVSQPLVVDGVRIVVDDSKAVFQSKSAGKNSCGYEVLQQVTLAGCRWCGLSGDSAELIHDLAPADQVEIRNTPWLKDFASESVATDSANRLVEVWKTGGAQLLGIQSRVITAASFNRYCDDGSNKSDLLSQTTLQLARSVLDSLSILPDESVAVYCDRHGGRRYYAGPLQSVFDGTLVGVIVESQTESSYRVPYGQRDFGIRFTVKGDSFTPVAFSSMVAKYLREKAMESLNAYFAKLHDEPQALRATAGYPVDADRFLSDIRPILKREKIDTNTLVRSR